METPSAGILMGFVGIWPFVGEKTGDFNRIIHVINGYMGWLSTYSWYRVKSECVGVLESKRWAWICNKQYHVGMICYRYPNHWDPIGILRNVDPSMANFEPRHTMYLTYLRMVCSRILHDFTRFDYCLPVISNDISSRFCTSRSLQFANGMGHVATRPLANSHLRSCYLVIRYEKSPPTWRFPAQVYNI